MTDDTALFDLNSPLIFPDDTARSRRNDPVTSHLAADSNSRATRNNSRAVVLDLLATRGPLADHEILAAVAGDLFLTPSRLRTARHELTEEGAVEDALLIRETPSGRRAKVWQLTKEAA